ncbi:unnamed protein product [Acanthoscelides obtectus]|uniref:Uncharacterized protein n=1 Tax=Acanthoscelides obtectus TaxID=200917 RepID=A0A9P0LUX4_ACAOB|nr:unnamed protein product [Acanthoscelides obtectus]CAK1621431.1 hypothetical protein AOBTE_LOCUS950 [Acanthoscelides obtectus]
MTNPSRPKKQSTFLDVLQLQERDKELAEIIYYIKSFIKKLEFWEQNLRDGNTSHFRVISEKISQSPLEPYDSEYYVEIVSKDNFKNRVKDFNEIAMVVQFVVSPFMEIDIQQFAASVSQNFSDDIAATGMEFHDFFNGLIGMDNLEELQARLLFQEGFLVTPYAKIKLLYQKPKNNLNFVTIEPRTELVIKVKTSISDGEIIIPHQKIHNCEIPECLTIAKDSYALTTLLNNTTDTVTLDFSEPLSVEPFYQSIHPTICQEFDLNNINDSPENKLDYSKIRVDHLNSEEQSAILKLCKEFSDIFYHISYPNLNPELDDISMIVNLDNETDQPDCQELPTVDNTNTDKDIINETEQTDYHELPFVIDKTNTNEDELDKDDETRHSNNQHPVVTIPISDQPLNFGQNQILIQRAVLNITQEHLFSHLEQYSLIIRGKDDARTRGRYSQ